MFRRWLEKIGGSNNKTPPSIILPAEVETYLVEPDGSKIRVLAWAITADATIALGPEGPMPLTESCRFQFATYGSYSALS